MEVHPPFPQPAFHPAGSQASLAFLGLLPQDIPADLALPWVQGLGSPRAGSRGEPPVGAASLPSPLSLV